MNRVELTDDELFILIFAMNTDMVIFKECLRKAKTKMAKENYSECIAEAENIILKLKSANGLVVD